MKKLQLIGISLLLGAIMLTGFASSAFALTGACQPVNNLATLSYSVGGVGQANIESSPTGNSSGGPGLGTNTSFFVDSKVDLSMTAAGPVTAIGLNNILQFSITNEGNDTQRYMLQLYAGSGETIGAYTDNFDMNNIRIVMDPAADGLTSTIDPVTGVITLAGGETQYTGVAADGSDIGLTPDVTGDLGGGGNVIDVYVIADVPGGQATDDDAMYSLVARTYQVAGATGTDGALGTETGNTSVDGNTAPSVGCAGGEVVLADGDADADGETPVGGLVGAGGDSTNNGDYFATGIYTVSSAVITVTKNVTTLWDPINGAAPNARPIPGAYVQYSITISNAALSAPATLNTINDTLAAQLAFDTDLNTAGAGTPESALGSGFKVEHTATRPSTASPSYYTSPSDADAVGHDGSATGGAITCDFALALPALDGYGAGELRGGESVTLTFNAIIQ